jgi:hypothetical protein
MFRMEGPALATGVSPIEPRRCPFEQVEAGLAALAMAAIGAADLLRRPALVEGLTRLGYPPDCASILGAWKLLGAVAIVAPGLPRLTEWAYVLYPHRRGDVPRPGG